MENLKVRMFRNGEEKVVNDLFNEVFSETRTLDEWRWKFKELPLSHINVVTVAEIEGNIVGQYANIPLLFKYKDKTVNFASPVDNFVVSAFRGGMKGIQSLMFEHQHIAARDNKVLLGLGFPNRDAYVIGKRVLKYKDMGDIHVIFARLNLRLGLKNKFPWMPGFLLKIAGCIGSFVYKIFTERKFQNAFSEELKTYEVQSFDNRFDSLWEKAKVQHEIIGQRDRKYLEWRYNKPGFAYRIFAVERGKELVGYIVTDIRKEADGSVVGHIVDLLTDNSEGVDSALIKAALMRFISEKADYALCWMLPDKPYYASMKKFGFIEKEAFAPVKAVYFIFDKETIDDSFVRDIKNWYLTMGDSDTF